MQLTVTPDRHVAAPGDVVVLDVVVRNDADVAVVPELRLRGVDSSDLLRVDTGRELSPGQRGHAQIEFRMPDDGRTGRLPVAVEVTDPSGGAPSQAVTLDLTIGARPPVTLDASPPTTSGRRRGHLEAVVRNDGDESLDLTVSGRADDVAVALSPTRLRLAPGAAQTLVASFATTRRSWTREIRHGATIGVRSGGPAVSTTVTFLQRPLLPPLLLRGTALLLVLALWAGAAVVVNGRLQAGELAGADVDATEDDGAPGEDGADGDGSDGDGTAGPGDGRGDDPTGGVGAAGDATEAGPVVLVGSVIGPEDPSGTGIVVERVGLGDAGTTDGDTKIAAQSGGGVPVTSVLERIETETDDRGRFTIASGVQTSAFYRVSAVRTGFEIASSVVRTGPDPAEYEVELELAAATGGMAGTVTSDDGQLLPGVEVVVEGAEIEYRATTGSDADAGRWSVDGMAAASSYAVTFRAPGYASATVVRGLAPGARLTDVDAVLTAGAGTVRGTASYRGRGVGGLDATISGPEATRSTTTLTDAGVEGLFTLPALPYGTYRLTLSGPGWLPQTAEVVVDRGDVVVDLADMRPSTASVSGLVLQQVVAGTCDYPDPEVPEQRDAIESSPCGGVGVTLAGEAGTYRTTTATGSGTFSLTGVQPGAYTATLQRFGYVTQNFLLQLEPGGIVDLGVVEPVQAAATGDGTRASAVPDNAIVLALLPPVDGTTGVLRGELRDASDPDTVFVPPAGTLITVEDQPQAAVDLGADGVFEVTGLLAGAATVRVDATGYDRFSTVARITEDGVTEAGRLPLVPLASLELRVTDTLEFPLADVVVFVTADGATDPALLSGASDVDARSCTVQREQGSQRWRETTTPDGTRPTLTGLCTTVAVDGTAGFDQAAGSGTYRLLAPVNEYDAAEDPAADPGLLSTTLPMDHQQLERTVDVRSGGVTRLDLRLRRYAVIEGILRAATDDGLSLVPVSVDDFTAAALEQFPATVVEGDDELGISFAATDGTVPPPGLEPRLSFGPDDGLPPSRYRISRVLPDEPGATRNYELGFYATRSRVFVYGGGAADAISSLSFGETRSAGAVLTAALVPVRVTVTDAVSGEPLDGVPVTGTGTVGFDEVTFQPRPPVTSDGVTGADPEEPSGTTFLLDDAGKNQQYLGGQEITVEANPGGTVPGYGTATFTGPLEFDGLVGTVELELEREPRNVTGTLDLAPLLPDDADPADVVTLAQGLDVALLPRGGDTPVVSSAATTITNYQPETTVTDPFLGSFTIPTVQPLYGFGLAAVAPGEYDLLVTGDNLLEERVQIDVPVGQGAVDAGRITVDRPYSLTVTVDETFTSLGGTPTQSAVDGVTVDLLLPDDSVAVSDVTEAGVAVLTGIRSGSFDVRLSRAGYVTVTDAAPPFDSTDLVPFTPDTTTSGTAPEAASRTIVRHGALRFVVQATAGNGNNPTELEDASVALTVEEGDTRTFTSDENGVVVIPSAEEIPEGSYSLAITKDGYGPVTVEATFTNAQETTAGTVADGEVVGIVQLTPDEFTLTGTVTDAAGDPLPFVRVTAYQGADVSVGGGGSTDCATVDGQDVSTATTAIDEAGDSVFTLAGLDAEDTCLQLQEVDADGTATARPPVEAGYDRGVFRGNGAGDAGEISFPASGALTGTVRGASAVAERPADGDAFVDPQGLVGATITATCIPTTTDGEVTVACPDDSSPVPVTSTTGGAYSFDGLPPGSYELTFAAPGYTAPEPVEVSVLVDTDQSAPTATLVARVRTVEVAVTSSAAGGQLPADITVTARDPACPADPDDTTSPDGCQLDARSASVVDGVASFTLPPTTWEFTTEQAGAPALPEPHTDIADADDVRRVVPVVGEDDPSPDPTVELGIQLQRWASFLGTTYGRAYAGDGIARLGGVGLELVPPTGGDTPLAIFEPDGAAEDGTSDSTGDWRIWQPEPEALTVRFSLDGYTARNVDLSSTGRDTTVPNVILVATPRDVELDVVSSDGASDLDGLTVTATSPTAPELGTRTGEVADGTATFTAPFEPVEWTFTTSGGPDLTTAHRDVTSVDAEQRTIELGTGTVTDLDALTVVRYYAYSGTVLEKDDAATADADATAAEDVAVVESTDPSQRVVVDPATTGTDGAWAALVPDGIEVELAFSKAGYDTGTLTITAADAVDQDVVLTATPVPTTVTTVDAATDDPVEGVEVVLTETTTAATESATSDAEGAADLGDVPPGTYGVTASGDGYEDVVAGDVADLEIAVGDAEATLTLSLTPTAAPDADPVTTTGQAVTYQDGVATRVADVVVTASTDGESLVMEPSTTSTDPAGNYTLTLPAGTWRLTAQRLDGPVVLVDDAYVVTAGDTGPAPTVVVGTDAGPDLAGTVTTAGGTPVPGARITAVSGGQTRLAVTGDDGSYLLPGLDPGVTFAVTYTPPSGFDGVPVTRFVAPGAATGDITLQQAIPVGVGALQVDVTGAVAGSDVVVTLEESGPFPTIAADGRLQRTITADGAGAVTTTFDQLVPGDDVSILHDRFTVVVTAPERTAVTVVGLEVVADVTTPVPVALVAAPAETRDMLLVLDGPDGPIDDRTGTLTSDGVTITGTRADGTNQHAFAAVETGRTWTLEVDGFEPLDVDVPEGTDTLQLELELVATVRPVDLTLTRDGEVVTSLDGPPTLDVGGTTITASAPVDPGTTWRLEGVRAGTWTLSVPGHLDEQVVVEVGDEPQQVTVPITPAPRDVEVALTVDGSPLVDVAPVLSRSGAVDVPGSESGTAGTYAFTGVDPAVWSLGVAGYDPVDIDVPIGAGTLQISVELTAT